MATKSAHWQAAFRRRMREAGLKAMTVWLPKEGIDRLARYPEKERGEVITRALVLLEPQGEFTGNDATLTDKLTGEPREEEEGKVEEDTLTLAGLFTRLERLEATLSTITSNSTGKLTGDDTVLTGESTRGITGNEPSGLPATLTGESTGELTGEATSITGESTDKSTGEGAVALSETPSPPVAEPPAKLPLKRVAALSRRAKRLSAQGVSWKAIAQRFNAENVPTLSGQGKWYGSSVKHMIEKQGRVEAE
jgi:recombinase